MISEVPAREEDARAHPRRGSVVSLLFPSVRRSGAASVEIPEGRAYGDAKRRDRTYRRFLATADVIVIALAIVVFMITGAAPGAPMLVALPLVVLVNKTIGLYDRDQHLLSKTTLDEAPRVLNVATLMTLILWLGAPVMFSEPPRRLDGVIFWFALTVALLLARAAARHIAGVFSPVERILVIGDRSAADRVGAKLEAAAGVKSRCIGHVVLTRRRKSDDPVALGTLADLGLVLEAQDIERVVIAPNTSAMDDDILYAIRLAKSLGVKVSVLPRLFEVVGSSVEFDHVQGVTLLGVRPYGLSKSSGALKRALDIVVSLLALIALAPVMLYATLAVTLTSPGGAFFRQRRIGFKGREFEIIKFRTMYADAEQRKNELMDRNEADGLFKIVDDPRITSVGRLLRKTSLDELPQLFNVLRGDMSLVGPRPLIPVEDQRITGLDRRRLHVMPGMTGHWQIFGSSRVPLDEMVKIDYLYGANWSLWGDLKIMIRTIPYMLARRGM